MLLRPTATCIARLSIVRGEGFSWPPALRCLASLPPETTATQLQDHVPALRFRQAGCFWRLKGTSLISYVLGPVSSTGEGHRLARACYCTPDLESSIGDKLVARRTGEWNVPFMSFPYLGRAFRAARGPGTSYNLQRKIHTVLYCILRTRHARYPMWNNFPTVDLLRTK